MKKITLMIVLMIMTITSSFALFVEIGDGTGTAFYVPFYGNYDYSWSSYILPADQIGGAIDINELQLNIQNSPTNYAMVSQQIYMKLTVANEVSVAYPNPTSNGYTLVFDGPITWNGSGWQGVILDTEFPYDGTSNLEIVWENNDGTYSGGYPKFLKTDTELNSSVYNFTDNSFPTTNGTTQTYFPNTRLGFTIEGAPSYPVIVSPANNMSNVELDTDLVWTIGDNTGFIHVYFSNNEEDVLNNSATALVVNGDLVTSFSPTLENGMVYYWKVVASNTTSETDVETTVSSFTTTYGLVEIPLTEGFEAVTPPALPLGWMAYNEGTASASSVKTYLGQAYEGNNSLMIANSGDASGTYIAILPQVENMGSRMKFYARCSSTGSQLKIGYLTDVSDYTSFTEIQTLNLTTGYQEVIIELELPRTVRYLGLKHGNVGTYQTIYIDNVVVEEIPENEPTPATLLTPAQGAIQVALNAELTWEYGINTVAVNLYLSDDLTEVTNLSDAAMVINNQNATSYIADLDEWTTYYWRVGSLNPTGYEVASSIASFTTVMPEGTFQIGYGTEINQGMPIEPYYGYTYTQTIYPQADINLAGDIQTIAWHYNGYEAWGPDDIKIYMAHTTLATYQTTTSWLALADLTLVYEGPLSVAAVNGWVPITLDTPFAYNNTDNLVIAVEENSQGYHSGSADFFNTAAVGNVSLTNHSDSTNPDPASPPTGTLKAFYPNIVLVMEAGEVPVYNPPTNFTAVIADENNVQINWTAPNARIRTLARAEYQAADTDVTRDLTGYTLYRNNVILAQVGTTVMSYLDEDLEAGSYAYKAVANYTAADSAPTPVVTIVIEEEVEELMPPELLTAEVNETTVTLNWFAPGDVPVGESFEDGFPPTGWTTVVNNTTQSWARHGLIVFPTGNVQPTHGEYQVGVMWDYAHQDEWLISPVMSEVTGLTFDFYGHYGSINGDNYFVKVSTDGGTTWTPVWNASDLPEADNNYATPVVIDLSAYASTPIKIAWNFVDGDGQGLWYASYIDNVIFELADTTRQGKFAEFVTVSKAVKTPEVRNDRDLTGYKVYRDEEVIATLAATVITYVDSDLANGDYEYFVTAMYGTDESEASNIVTATVDYTIPVDYFFEDSFESYTDFAIEAAPWVMFDGDLGNTYTFQSSVYDNAAAPKAYLVFNPSTTVPALPGSAYAPLDGSKYMACFSSLPPAVNNDWMMTPAFTLGDSGTFNFWGRTYMDYGLEQFNVLVSNGSTDPEDFTSISGPTSTSAPLAWTQFSYSLDAYANQTIRVAIQCVSSDVFVFMVDQVQIEAPNAAVSNNNNEIAAVSQLIGNYPNPFNPETTIAFSTKENGSVTIDIFNIKGQKIRTLLNENKEAGSHTAVWNGKDDNGKKVASGVFFYRMKSGKFSSTKKMILMK